MGSLQGVMWLPYSTTTVHDGLCEMELEMELEMEMKIEKAVLNSNSNNNAFNS